MISASFKKVGLMAKEGNKKAAETAKKIVPWLQRKKCEVLLPEEIFSTIGWEGSGKLVSLSSFSKEVDLILSLGGDGTFLKSVRLLHGRKAPVVGVKLGGVGFLTDILPAEVEKGLEIIFNKKAAIEERVKLKANVFRLPEGMKDGVKKEVASFEALNDAVLHTSGIARISGYRISIWDNHFTTLNADGVLVATPTGSTAYSFAAGGPVTHPEAKVLIVTPICPQNLANRSLIVADETKIGIELVSHNSEVLLTMDGQETYIMKEGDTVWISKSDHSAYFLGFSGKKYLESLRNKLFLEPDFS
jgi:NAD+ kinase